MGWFKRKVLPEGYSIQAKAGDLINTLVLYRGDVKIAHEIIYLRTPEQTKYDLIRIAIIDSENRKN